MCGFDPIPSWWLSFAATARGIGIEGGDRFSLTRTARTASWSLSARKRPLAKTAGRDAKIDWKALSQRIGHADVAFTMKQYVQTDLEADRQVAITLAELIIGGQIFSAGRTAGQAP